jgi:hypothetical protein
MRLIILVFTLLVLTACSSVSVNTDFVPGTDFSHIKTYAWIKKPAAANPLLEKRIIDDINLQLAEHGWKNVDSHEAADAAVSGTITTQDQERVDTTGNGGYGWRRGGMGGMSSSTVYHETVGTLIVDIFDTKTKDAIWRGTASGTASSDPETNTKNTRNAIQEMFKNFPPGSAVVKK